MSKRSGQQNSGIHLFCQQLADALNDAGYDMKKVFEVKAVDVPWNQEMVKEVLWKQIQIPMFDKVSTTDLETDEVSQVYETLNRHMSSNFSISIPFPSYDEQVNNSRVR